MAAARPGSAIESVDRALILLNLFAELEEISVAEASRRLAVSRSTAYRLLAMLEYQGFVRRTSGQGPFRLGPAIMRLGLSALRHLDIAGELRPVLAAIAAEAGETTHLVTLRGDQAVFLDCVEGSSSIRAASRTGTSLPALRTASGRAMLADLGTLDAHIPPDERDDIERRLAEVRATGYAVNRGETEPGLWAVAMSVEGTPVPAAVTVAGPTNRIDASRVNEIAAILRRHLRRPD